MLGGAPGGFVARLEQGTHSLTCSSTWRSSCRPWLAPTSGSAAWFPWRRRVWWLIIVYDEEEVGLASWREAVRLVRACIDGEPFDTDAVVQELGNLFEDVRLGPSTGVIVEEARRRAIPVRRLNSSSLVQLGQGRNLRRIQATVTGLTNSIAVEIAQDKEETKRVLENVGLPVPSGRVVSSLEAAIAAADQIGYPVILKPLNLNHGRGISSRLDDRQAVRDAWATSSERSRRLIVETFSMGRDHRVLVVNGCVIACAERVAAHVVGNGQSTIRQLIVDSNRDPRRGRGHTKVLTYLPCDHRQRSSWPRAATHSRPSLPGRARLSRPRPI